MRRFAIKSKKAMKNQTIINTLESLTLVIGRLATRFSVLIMLLTFIVVVMRYGFNTGSLQIFGWKLSSIAIDETVIYLHASLFMLASAMTLKEDAHVRVDVFYRNFSSKIKSLVNLLGTLLLLFPMSGVILWTSLDYVSLSWKIQEHSQEAEGLPYLFILKGMIPTMAILLLVQGVFEIIKHGMHVLGKGPFPQQGHEETL
ncbi:MAG: TRAP transporter small permease subunit [Pseudomonadales bacterium]|nr:TRAP transporter small permease subunit [Pseudomonadales bacterium]